MAEITTAFPSARIPLRQVDEWEARATSLYNGNKTKMLKDLLDSDEIKAFFNRRWREERKRFEKGGSR